MTEHRFIALSTEAVRNLQAGAADANGQAPERDISDGSGLPCRHCLSDVAAGEPFLVLAHRPFPEAQPYAETGPIFLHAEPCERHGEGTEVPALFLSRAQALIRGYGADDRIVTGTGQVVASAEISALPIRPKSEDGDGIVCRRAHEWPQGDSWGGGKAVTIDNVEGDAHARIRASRWDRAVRKV